MKSLIKKDTQQLRKELQNGKSKGLKNRRGIIALSLLGMGAMTAVTLLQTGIIKHLPDPPLPDFDSDKVNSSDTAYALGVPDGAMSLASLAANIPIAAFGGEDRAETMPFVPLAAAAKSSVEAAVAGWYFISNARQRRKMVRLLYRRRTRQCRHCCFVVFRSKKSVGKFDAGLK